MLKFLIDHESSLKFTKICITSLRSWVNNKHLIPSVCELCKFNIARQGKVHLKTF